MYTYNAKIIKVYDGDTVTALVDLGFKISFEMKLRLNRINAPEIRGIEKEKGKITRDRLRELILDKTVVIKTNKDKTGKYGRYIADIYLGEISINDLLVTENLAIYKSY